jgi:hypothetical protein
MQPLVLNAQTLVGCGGMLKPADHALSSGGSMPLVRKAGTNTHHRLGKEIKCPLEFMLLDTPS